MSFRKPQASKRNKLTGPLLWICVALELAFTAWLMTGGLPSQTSPTNVVVAHLHTAASTHSSVAVTDRVPASKEIGALSSIAAAFHLVPTRPAVTRAPQSTSPPLAEALPKATPQPVKDATLKTKVPPAIVAPDDLLSIKRAEEAASGDRYVLVGIVGSDEAPNTAILLDRDTGETLVLSVGDTLDGRAIQSIDESVVVMGPPSAPTVQK